MRLATSACSARGVEYGHENATLLENLLARLSDRSWPKADTCRAQADWVATEQRLADRRAASGARLKPDVRQTEWCTSDENLGGAPAVSRRPTSARSQILRHLLAWAAIGICVPLILLLLDHVAGSIINSFPLGVLFLAWPTAFMMWMVSPDWLGVGIAAASVAANSLLYVGVGRLLWGLRNRAIRRPT